VEAVDAPRKRLAVPRVTVFGEMHYLAEGLQPALVIQEAHAEILYLLAHRQGVVSPVLGCILEQPVLFKPLLHLRVGVTRPSVEGRELQVAETAAGDDQLRRGEFVVAHTLKVFLCRVVNQPDDVTLVYTDKTGADGGQKVLLGHEIDIEVVVGIILLHRESMLHLEDGHGSLRYHNPR